MPTEGCITVISGCPGTGKTALSRALAHAAPLGLHLIADDFYAYPAHPIPPWLPESRAQNTAIVRAVARASGAFAEAGYQVLVDAVLGPWLLAPFAQELATHRIRVQYAVLRAGLDETLRRAAEREDGLDPGVVRHMHAAFAEIGRFESHVVETDSLPLHDVQREVERRLREGVLELDLAALAA